MNIYDICYICTVCIYIYFFFWKMLRMIFLCWWCLHLWRVLFFQIPKFRYSKFDPYICSHKHIFSIRMYISDAWQKSSQSSMSWKVLHHPFWHPLVHLGGVMGCREIEEQAQWLGDQSLGAYWLPFCRCFSKSFLGKMRSTWFLFGAFWNWWIDYIIGFDVDTIRMGVDKIWYYICTYRLDRVE